MERPFLRFAAWLLVFAAVPAFANETAEWRPVDEEMGSVRDIEGLEQLARDFPDSGTVRLRLLQPYLGAGETEKVLATLKWLYDRGYVFSDVAQQQIPNLVGEEYAERARALLLPEAESIEVSEVRVTTPAEVGLAESVLRDPVEDRIIVTSVSERAVFGRKSAGGWDGVQFESAGNLSGIAMAPESRIIWIASGHIDGSDHASGISGLIGMDHAKNSEIRISAPKGVSFSDLTVVKGEIAFASDPVGGGVYQIQTADAAVNELVAPGTLRSPQGLTLSEDGELLYVSDYRYGVAIVNLKSGKISRLSTSLPLILDGIDGMWRYGNELIVVQNGTSPMRIAAFELSDDGMSVVAHRVLEQAHSEWTEPLSGNIDDDSLIYVGNGQWDRFVAGEQAQDKPPLPTQIRSLPIGRE